MVSEVEEESRPDPDALLRAAEKEQEGKGKLKVFFGMAAGVGKTYSMLTEGRRMHTAGIDVVIGYLESHQRKDTDELAAGLPLLPRMKLDYRGRPLEEMDLDAVLARRPALVLVDELAHTNAPGARNRKRYQDVLELIEAGIDVYTTVNVQHLEGFADTVEEITGISIVERIPDSVFDIAEQVVLIDVSPEELLKRLSEGKVYLGDRAEAAAENFFKKSTLTALREMALRHTALLVTHQLADYAQEHGQRAAAISGERLLVAISPSPYSAHLIRWTRQRAFNLKGEWTALFVETGAPLDDAAQGLAEEEHEPRPLAGRRHGHHPLGQRPPRRHPLRAAERHHRDRGGQVGHGRGSSRRHRGKDHEDERRHRRGGGPGEGRRACAAAGAPVLLPAAREGVDGKMLLVIAVVTGVNLLAVPLIGYRSASILYLLAVIGLAFSPAGWRSHRGGPERRPVGLLLPPPRFTFYIGKLDDALMFALYFVTAAALAYLMARLRANQRMLAVRTRRMTLLLDFSQELSHHHSLADIVTTGVSYISRYVEADAIVFLRDEAGGLERTVRALKETTIDEKEFGVARWCFDSRTPCGRFTDTLHMARYHYIPLLTPDEAVGVLGISPEEGKSWLQDQEDSLQMLGRSLSLSLERELLAEENRRNLMARESERLGRVLLNTVSHELRTPLTTIKGSITALMDGATGEDPKTRDILLSETLTATDRLNAIVENLLSMSRLESGMLRLKRSDTDIVDLVSVVADALRRQSKSHPLAIKIDAELPLVSIDFILIVQVLSNILANAARHTPAGTPITLGVERIDRGISMTVADTGPGVTPRSFRTCLKHSSAERRRQPGGSDWGCPSARASWRPTAGGLPRL